MLESKPLGIIAAVAAIGVFAALLAGNVAAQTNEKRIERDASGLYKGKTTNSRIQFKTDGHVTFTGHPDDGQGKMRIPVKDGKLKTTARDEDIPGPADKAKFKGTEKKSNVAANGNKIRVVATGQMNVEQDGNSPFRNGKVRGRLVKRGGKWVSDVVAKGERDDGGGHSTCLKTVAKGKN